MLSFIINNEKIDTDLPEGTILVDFIREHLGLSGTKVACREGECGACTVLVGKLKENNVEYNAVASCILPIGDVKNCHIVTVEGVNRNDDKLNRIQQFIIDNNASQCGFCTPGIVLSLTGFSILSKDFSYEDVIDSLDGNICRCTGYAAIRKAAKQLANFLQNQRKNDRIKMLVDNDIIPEYFLDIPEKLKKISLSNENKKVNNSVVIGGGTDLFVQKPDDLENEKLYFLSQNEQLDYIKSDKKILYVGGSVTLEKFRNSEIVNKIFPQMKQDVLLHSSTILRNKATLTGNIVNASPIGDITIMLLALDAELVIENNNELRNVKLNEFYSGYKQMDLKKNEIIKEIKIPIPENDFYYNFEKVSNRKILDIAAVNSGMFLSVENNKIKNIRISVGGVAPIPLFIKGLEKFVGQEISDELVCKLSEYVKNLVEPIDDVRGTAKYKKMLAKQLVVSHLKKYIKRS